LQQNQLAQLAIGMMAGGGGGEIPGLPGFRLTPFGQDIASGRRQPPTTPATVEAPAAVGDAAAVAPAAGPAAGAPLFLADAPADHEVEAAGHGDTEPAASVTPSPKPKAGKGSGGKVKMSIDEMAASFAKKLKKDIVQPDKTGSVCKRPAAAPSGNVMKKTTPAAAPSGTVMKKTKVLRRAAWPLKYPGIPKAAKDAVTVGDFRLMTDVQRQQWRLRKIGERPDKAFSWKVDGSESWKRMAEYWQNA